MKRVGKRLGMGKPRLLCFSGDHTRAVFMKQRNKNEVVSLKKKKKIIIIPD